MNNLVSITLESVDLLQTIDALVDRAESWEKTESILSGTSDFDDDFFVAEECHDSHEAAEIARHYRDIISKIEVHLTAARLERR